MESAFKVYNKDQKKSSKKALRERIKKKKVDHKEEFQQLQEDLKLLKKVDKSSKKETAEATEKPSTMKAEIAVKQKMKKQQKAAKKVIGIRKNKIGGGDKKEPQAKVNKKQRGKKAANGSGNPNEDADRMSDAGDKEEVLNGDDVPLVEQVMLDMYNNETKTASKTTHSLGGSNGINEDNFMKTVLKSNRANKSPKDENSDEDGGSEDEVNENEADDDDDSSGIGEFVHEEEEIPEPEEELPRKKGEKNKKRKMVETGINSVSAKEAELKKRKKEAVTKSKAESVGSVEQGEELFSWMMHPIDVDKFLAESFEKRPIHVKRGGKSKYYSKIFSTGEFDRIMRHQTVIFGKNLDVTSYDPEKGRETHNPVGRAYPAVVWDFYNNGCSLRMLNPQTFSDEVWKTCATLQDFFGSMVGANMYLTPPGTQGFAPHYDDVEVFICQLEGRKRWRLYAPQSERETLPRFSSPNFDESDIGEPILDVVLEAGDLIYMPRGTIHQGNCLEDAHSLHITFSCHQRNTFGDLLEKIVPTALSTAIEEDVEFRKSLPLDYLSLAGLANADLDESSELAARRKTFMNTVFKLMGNLFKYAPVDAGVDQMGKRFIHDSLPPHLTPKESKRTVEEDGERWNQPKTKVVNRVEMDPGTEIRLLRNHCIRLITEESEDNNAGEGEDEQEEETSGTVVKIYYNVENNREFHGPGSEEPNFLEIGSDLAPAVEALLSAYPKYMKIEDLPLEGLDQRMAVAQDLWERKLVMSKDPLESHYDD